MIRTMQLRYLRFAFVSLITIFNLPQALADVILPSVNEKYVSLKEENPTRDVGYVVGDVISRSITLTIKKPYELVKESIPIVGYEHRWKGQISGIELVKATTKEIGHSDSTTHILNLSYQVFTTGKVAKPAALRAEILKLRNTKTKEVVQYRVPAFNIRVSPLSVFGQVKLKEEMSPFTPPLLLDASKEILNVKILAGVLAISLLGLLYIFGMRTWLPRMGAPFAKAYRDIRKMADTPEGLQQAVSRMHQSLNKTAGTSLFSNNLERFIERKSGFAPMQAEIEKFFGLSRQVFFEPEVQQTLGESPKTWLLKFCKHLRDCERGLVPNITQEKGV